VNRAFVEALEWVNADKRRAAKLYVEMAHEKKLS
jgi:ABC-type nitrate/sulfonate/bicarbonate transport system substrate-binding protein